MSNKKLAGIIAGCIVVVIVIVIIATLPPPGEADENTAFHINVIPEQLNGASIARQHCVFLVTITEEEQECELPVRISATAPGSEVVIYQEDIKI